MYKGNDYRATIVRHNNRFLLEVRDKKGRMTHRRWHSTFRGAESAVWRWIDSGE